MGTDRDLAWWHIPRWASAGRRSLATGLVVGLPGGLAFGLQDDFTGGLVFGLLFGLGAGFAVRHVDGEPRRVRIANWRAAISPQILRKVVVGGLWGALSLGAAMGLTYGLVDEFAAAVEYRLIGALTVGLMFGFALGLVLELAFELPNVLVEAGAAEGNPVGPSEIWSKDRIGGLVSGLAVGFVVGLVAGLTAGFVYGLVVGLAAGLTAGFVLGLTAALTSCQTWPTTLAWLQLRRSGQVSAVGLMRFLEDARDRDVLRTVGAVYQFRHAMLQDQLAEHAAADSAASAAVLRTS